jgi:hypothetical protein
MRTRIAAIFFAKKKTPIRQERNSKKQNDEFKPTPHFIFLRINDRIVLPVDKCYHTASWRKEE